MEPPMEPLLEPPVAVVRPRGPRRPVGRHPRSIDYNQNNLRRRSRSFAARFGPPTDEGEEPRPQDGPQDGPQGGPQGETPQDEPPQGAPPQDDPPQDDSPQGDSPQGDPPQGEPPQGEPPQDGLPQGDQPESPMDDDRPMMGRDDPLMMSANSPVGVARTSPSISPSLLEAEMDVPFDPLPLRPAHEKPDSEIKAKARLLPKIVSAEALVSLQNTQSIFYCLTAGKILTEMVFENTQTLLEEEDIKKNSIIVHMLEHMGQVPVKILRELFKVLEKALFNIGYNFKKCNVGKVIVNCPTFEEQVSFDLKYFTDQMQETDQNAVFLLYDILENEGEFSPQDLMT